MPSHILRAPDFTIGNSVSDDHRTVVGRTEMLITVCTLPTGPADGKMEGLLTVNSPQLFILRKGQVTLS